MCILLFPCDLIMTCTRICVSSSISHVDLNKKYYYYPRVALFKGVIFSCPFLSENGQYGRPALLTFEYGPFQTTATFQHLYHLSCLCKSGNLCTEADLLKYCYLLR